MGLVSHKNTWTLPLKMGQKPLALTDHGSMNGLSYQLLRAKEMKAQGKDFKPIFGVEAYYIDSLEEWQTLRNEIAQDKKASKRS
jgi:DNA polymerase III alpha subunit